MAAIQKGRPLPKFGEWDVNDPTSSESFTVIFNKARDEKKTGGKPDSPTQVDTNARHGVESAKPRGGSCYVKHCIITVNAFCRCT